MENVYYEFDCMNALLEGKLFPTTEFNNEREAKQMAADYEATLYKHQFDNEGNKIKTTTLYDPWDCF